MACQEIAGRLTPIDSLNANAPGCLIQIMRILSIKAHLLLLSSVCVALLAGLSVLVVLGSRSDAAALRDLYEERFQPMLALQDSDRQLREVRFRLAGVLLDQIPVTGSRNHLNEARQQAPARWAGYVRASGLSTGERQTLMKRIDAGWKKFDRFAAELNAAYASNDRKKLATLLEDDWPAVHIELVKPLEALLPLAIREAETVYAGQSKAAAQRQAIAVTSFAIGGLALAGFLVGFTRRVQQAFSQIVEAMRRLAEGDLEARLDAKACAETVVIGREFGLALDQLNGLVARIHEIATHMQAVSGEIAQGHELLSGRTEAQAASLEQTAASMEQMASTVSQNAENARNASVLSAGASAVAVRGGEAVGTVVSTMTGISESSKKIADIISVIDSIAFQTNILALNAAVEAAHAGEQGRGFAVVAAEVRTLAHRSAEASREIRQLIMESVARIDAGSHQVQTAGATMAEIVDAVTRVNTLISEISTASQEQSQSLVQVSNTVQQLEKVTQQNAAMVGANAATSLEDQASALMRAVRGFKLAAPSLSRDKSFDIQQLFAAHTGV